MAEYRCPKCHSHRVKASYPDIECLACGWSEPLVDFPISFNEHRRHCLEFGRQDPGSCEPPEHTIDELHERLVALEEATLSREEPRSERKPKLSGGISL